MVKINDIVNQYRKNKNIKAVRVEEGDIIEDRSQYDEKGNIVKIDKWQKIIVKYLEYNEKSGKIKEHSKLYITHNYLEPDEEAYETE